MTAVNKSKATQMIHTSNAKTLVQEEDRALYHRAFNRRKSLAQCFLEDTSLNLMKNIQSPSDHDKKSMTTRQSSNKSSAIAELSSGSDETDTSSSSDDESYERRRASRT